MQQRSPVKILWLSTCTLGFYNLYWLASTRNELVSKSARPLPANSQLITIAVLRLISLGLLTYAVLNFIINFHSNGAYLAPVSFACLGALICGIAAFKLFSSWLIPFVTAASDATNGVIDANNIMSLMLTRESFAVSTIQQAFNAPSSIPAFASKNYLPELQARTQRINDNPMLHRILSVIAILVVTVFVLMVAGLFIFYSS